MYMKMIQEVAMIELKIMDDECLEGIRNDFINSNEQLSAFQLQLRDEEEYVKLDALIEKLKESMAGCPEADLKEKFEDAVYWKSAYENNMAYLDGIRKGFNLRRFLMEETDLRQQAKAEATP